MLVWFCLQNIYVTRHHSTSIVLMSVFIAHPWHIFVHIICTFQPRRCLHPWLKQTLSSSTSKTLLPRLHHLHVHLRSSLPWNSFPWHISRWFFVVGISAMTCKRLGIILWKQTIVGCTSFIVQDRTQKLAFTVSHKCNSLCLLANQSLAHLTYFTDFMH